MAFHISQYKHWQAGPGTPVKYSVQFELDCALVSQTSTTATFSLTGTVTVVNYPQNSRNSFPASDFAVLTLGGFDPINYQFTEGISYYEAALPALPNAPQSYLDALRIEFRGDTYRGDGANRVSLWVAGQGLMLDAANTQGSWPITINQTFTINLTGSQSQDILIYTHSGARSATGYDWLAHEVWASLFNFDYRPGASWNADWFSHNRPTGACNIWTGSTWKELRTQDGGSGAGDPPLIYNGSQYVNQRKIGSGG